MYRRLLSKARHILTKQLRNRIKLNKCFNEIVSEFSIDYCNKEFQAIQSAVLEYLNRIKLKINERGLFKIVRIQPGGSMVERTAMWKMDEHGMPYIEFDFLAVLQAPDTFCPIESAGHCCMKVSGCQLLDTYLMQEYGYSIFLEMIISRESAFGKNNNGVVDRCFLAEMSSFVIPVSNRLSAKEGSWEIQLDCCSSGTANGCDTCTVRKPLGQLRLARRCTRKCSLPFIWTSNAKSLLAPVSKQSTCKKLQRLQHLHIDVDFLPALELFHDDQKLEHKCFLVPKSCRNGHFQCWRKSQCTAEIAHFRS